MVALQRGMIGQAALIMLVAFAAGTGLLISLVGGVEVYPGAIFGVELFGSPESWGRAHLGGLINAILVIVVALLIPVVGFEAGQARRLGFLVVATGWANTLFFWLALLSPNRALTFGTSRLGEGNWIGAIGLAPALVFTVVIIAVFIAIARQAFARQG